MKAFTISRIHTPLGIFKITGTWQGSNKLAIQINHLAIMSTDGWVILDHHSPKSQQLVSELTPFVLAHLQEKST